jgi:hypothetical protein
MLILFESWHYVALGCVADSAKEQATSIFMVHMQLD